MKNLLTWYKLENKNNSHIISTLLKMADEFLVQYLHSAKINGFCFVSRLFIMGHALELYAKCNLLKIKNLNEMTNHNVAQLLKEIDPKLSLSKEVIDAGKELYSETTTNFKIGLKDKYSEELEIYLITYKLANLKYYISKIGKIIFPVTTNTKYINDKYIQLVGYLRNSIKEAHNPKINENLKGVINFIGIDLSRVSVIFCDK